MSTCKIGQHRIKKSGDSGITVNRNDRFIIFLRLTHGRGFALEHITYELVRHKKHDQAKITVEKLFYYTGAFSYKYTASFPQIIGAVCRMPDLSPLHHINDV